MQWEVGYAPDDMLGLGRVSIARSRFSRDDYFYCGGNLYRAVFQGNSLVYVTAKPQWYRIRDPIAAE